MDEIKKQLSLLLGASHRPRAVRAVRSSSWIGRRRQRGGDGRQGGRNRNSGQVIPKDPTGDPQGQSEPTCNGKQDNKCREKPEISHQVSEEEDSDYSDKSDGLALIRDVDQLKGPAVPG
jgi:hypothetical protein